MSQIIDVIHKQPAGVRDVGGQRNGEFILRGGIFSARRIVMGKAFVCFRELRLKVNEFESASLAEAEMETAMTALKKIVLEMREMITADSGEDNEFRLLMLDDLEARLLKLMGKENVNAAAAAKTILEQMGKNTGGDRRHLYDQTNALLVDILNRLVGTVENAEAKLDEMDGPVVLVCRDMPDSYIRLLGHPKVAGLIREEGGKRDHISVVELQRHKKLGVISVRNATAKIGTGDELIVNGFNREVVVKPLDKTKRRAKRWAKHFLALGSSLAAERTMAVETLDKRKVRLNLNAERPQDVADHLELFNGDIGLVRLELALRLDADGYPRRAAPSIKEQIEMFEAFIAQLHAGGRPNGKIYFRTFDLDIDKELPFLDFVGFDHAEVKKEGFGMFLNPKRHQLYLLFRNQLEALLMAKDHKCIMFPNVINLRDFAGAMAIADAIKHSYRGQERRIERETTFGIMLEHPQVIRDMRQIIRNNDLKARKKSRLDEIGFVSIGTSDLTKNVLKLDRGSSQLSAEFDELHPKVIGMVGEAVELGRELGIEVSCCGDMGNDPLALPVLIGMGLQRLSLSPDFVDIGRRIIRSISYRDAREMVKSLAGVKTAEQVRRTVADYYQRQIQTGVWAGLEEIKEFILDEAA